MQISGCKPQISSALATLSCSLSHSSGAGLATTQSCSSLAKACLAIGGGCWQNRKGGVRVVDREGLQTTTRFQQVQTCRALPKLTATTPRASLRFWKRCRGPSAADHCCLLSWTGSLRGQSQAHCDAANLGLVDKCQGLLSTFARRVSSPQQLTSNRSSKGFRFELTNSAPHYRIACNQSGLSSVRYAAGIGDSRTGGLPPSQTAVKVVIAGQIPKKSCSALAKNSAYPMDLPLGRRRLLL